MATFIFVVGGIGAVTKPTQAQKDATVASVTLFISMYSLSWAPVSYIVLGETPSQRVKEKTNNLAVSISVITTFLISFTLPYLLNAPYANLGAKVGFIYGSTTVLSVVVAYIWIPEMKGLSLEEVNHLFATKTPLRKFQQEARRIREEETALVDKERSFTDEKTSIEPTVQQLEEKV